MTQSEWQSSCAIGLASCRLRAESLARQVYCKPFPSMDERPSAAAVVPHPVPVRQQPSTAATSQTALLAIENGTAGGNPWPPPQLPPPDNFLVRTGRALYERLYSLLQDQAVDCVVQYCEQGDQEPSSTSLDDDVVAGLVPVPQEVVIAVAGTEESSSADSEDAPAYPPEHEVARAALAHRRLPEVDGYPFPVVQGLVRPGVTVQNSDDSSSSEAAEEPFHDATEGLAEEFRDESSCSSSEVTSEERVQVPEVAKAESSSTNATPDLPFPPNRTRSHRFAKHRFLETPRPVVTRKVEAPESPSLIPPGRTDDVLSSSNSSTPELSSPSPGERTPTPPTPPKPLDSDEDDSASIRAPLVRSTSLKTGKSPPGTPFKKKIVRFADAMGLDLAAVRTIVSEDIPQIPASAFSDLRGIEPRVHAPSPLHLTLVPLFQQPGASADFWKRLTTQRVCLESVVVTGCALHIVIRVLNVAFEKLVILRYSLNEWRSFCDLRALYLPMPSDSSSDGLSDRFGVDLYLPPDGRPRLQMCVRYIVGECEFWDNNAGNNYRFEFRDSPKEEVEVTPLMNYL